MPPITPRDITIIVILCITLSTITVALKGIDAGKESVRAEAIEHNAAQYNHINGEFEWKDLVPPPNQE